MTKVSQNIGNDATSPLISGDSRVIECTVQQSSQAAFNLTGAVAIKWQMFAMSGGTFTGAALISKSLGSGVEITNAAGGIFQVTITSSDTANKSGTYYHEAEVTMPSNVVHTVFTGTITFVPGAIP